MIESGGPIENEFPALNFKYNLFICHGIHYEVVGVCLIAVGCEMKFKVRAGTEKPKVR
jgi:hypothetical protein